MPSRSRHVPREMIQYDRVCSALASTDREEMQSAIRNMIAHARSALAFVKMKSVPIHEARAELQQTVEWMLAAHAHAARISAVEEVHERVSVVATARSSEAV